MLKNNKVGSESPFEIELEKKGRGRRFLARPWAWRTFKLQGSLLEYYSDGKLKDTVNLLGSKTERLEPRQAENKPFPFVVRLQSGEVLLLNAHDENSRVLCLDTFNSAGNSTPPAKAISTSAVNDVPTPISNDLVGLAARPMRLLRANMFGELYPIPPYELIPDGCYISVPFAEFVNSYHEKTAVISWRWGPKPLTLQDAEDRQKRALTVSKDLVNYCSAQLRTRPDIEYIWLDWACIPQYQGPEMTMEEINRSGNYYRLAKMMIVWCFQELSERSFKFEYSSYFGRVWTLSERLHRGLGQDPLSVADFLPLALRSFELFPDNSLMRASIQLNSSFHGEDDNRDEWIPIKFHQFFATLSQDNSWEVVPMKILHEKIDLVVSKYSRLRRVQEIIQSHLSLLLDSPSFHFMHLAVRLFAYFEWMKEEEASENAPTRKVPAGMMREMLYSFLYNWTLRERKLVDNLNFLSSSKSLEECRALLSQLNLSALGVMKNIPASVNEFAVLGSTAEKIWHHVSQQLITEKVSEAWLARYLVYHAGRVYKAFDPYDLFLAIQKLFQLPDCRDRDSISDVWQRLASVAGIETGSVYAWIRNITRPGSDPFLCSCSFSYKKRAVGEGSALSDNPFVEAISPDSGLDSLNYAVLGFDRGEMEMKKKAEKPLGFEEIFFQALKASPESRGWLVSDDNKSFSYALGLYFAADRSIPTALLENWAYVPISQGNEIDTHLSLRGRSALRDWEIALREEIGGVLAIESSQRCIHGNALFLITRYNPFHGHARTALFWVFGHMNADGVKEWCVEGLASLPSMPMKGSPWGICQVYNLLGAAAVSSGMLPAHIGVHSDLPESVDCSERIKIDLPTVSGQLEDWWRSPWTAAIGVMKELLPAEPSLDEKLAKILAALTPYQQRPKSRLIQEDLMYLDLLEDLITLLGVEEPVPSLYYKMLQSNYFYDREMAKKLDYFTEYGKKLCRHLTVLPSALFRMNQIGMSISNFIDDLFDAIEYAEDDDVDGAVVEEAKSVLSALRAARR